MSEKRRLMKEDAFRPIDWAELSFKQNSSLTLFDTENVRKPAKSSLNPKPGRLSRDKTPKIKKAKELTDSGNATNQVIASVSDAKSTKESISSIAVKEARPVTVDNSLDSLVKYTQEDAKKFFKSRKLPDYKIKHRIKATKRPLVIQTSSVVYTNGSEELDEDVDYYKISQHKLAVPWIGTDPSRLTYSDNLMWDITAESTNMPVFCKMLILHQGACLVNSPAVLTRDAAVQIGDDFISVPLTDRLEGTTEPPTNNDIPTRSSKDKKQRRLSWTLTDEYYSVPQYQYRGKQGVQRDMDIQVDPACFEMNTSRSSGLELAKPVKSDKRGFVAKMAATHDIIDYLRVSALSKSELMSERTLHTTADPDKRFIFNADTWTRARKVVNSDFTIDTEMTFNNYEPQRLEHTCPKTGVKRTTVLTPQRDSNSIEMEQFEEYTATDAACDTADLNMHVNFENYTYVQLLSETVSFDRKLQRNLSLLSSSFRLKKKMEEETSLARSKSNVSQLKDGWTLTESQDMFNSQEDDISDILARYNIRGYADKQNSPGSTARDDSKAPTTSSSTTSENQSISFSVEQKPLTNSAQLTSSSTTSSRTQIDLTDLFIDLNLCVSTPRSQDEESEVNETLRNSSGSLMELESETTSDFMHNDAKYPLISRAIYKPTWSIQNMRPPNSPSLDSQLILSHRNCHCFEIPTGHSNHSDQPQQHQQQQQQQQQSPEQTQKRSEFKREYNSFRPTSNLARKQQGNVNRLVEMSLLNSARLNISSLNKLDSQSCTFDMESASGKNLSNVSTSSRESLHYQQHHQKHQNNKPQDIRNQIVLIPAFLSTSSSSLSSSSSSQSHRRTNQTKTPPKPQIPSNLEQKKPTTASVTPVFDQIKENLKSENEYFKRGRYLRSSYDRSLLMYSQRDSGLSDSTNSSIHSTPRHQISRSNSSYSTSTIDKMVQKFRSKLHGLKSKERMDSKEAGPEDTLVI